MIVSSENLDALRVQVEAGWEAGYEETETWWPKLAMTVPSSSDRNRYRWILEQLQLRQWIGQRIAQAISEHDYDIVNLPFEGTIELDRDRVEDDTFGTFSAIQAPAFGEAVRKHPDQMVLSLLTGSPVGFDGKTLFANDHPTYAPGGLTQTYDNLRASSPLTPENLDISLGTTAQYVGENGRSLGVLHDTLIVGPALKRAALEATNGMVIRQTSGTGASTVVMPNVEAWGSLDIVVIPELAGTDWYTAKAKGRIKPFIYQKRRDPVFVSFTDPKDPELFRNRKFVFGVDYRAGFGVTLPFLITKHTA